MHLSARKIREKLKLKDINFTFFAAFHQSREKAAEFVFFCFISKSLGLQNVVQHESSLIDYDLFDLERLQLAFSDKKMKFSIRQNNRKNKA